MKRTVWITGASSGIGKAIAEKLSTEEYRLILSARRLEKLEEIGRASCRERVYAPV